jgi:DNA-binding transcriptional MerR regulator
VVSGRLPNVAGIAGAGVTIHPDQHSRLIVGVVIMPDREAGGWMHESVGFPIGFVSLRTGLSVHALRAWERRYRAVTPQRSAGGQRLYSQADIDRLLLLKRAIQKGQSISHIAGLGQAELLRIAGSDPVEPASAGTRSKMAAGTHLDQGADIVDACLDAVTTLDGGALHRMLKQAAAHFSRQAMIDTVVRPLAEEIGCRWSEGALRIVHGHLASVVIHRQLIDMLNHSNADTAGQPCVLITTPPGQHCYLGALAAAVTAQDHGWTPVFLGPNLPVEEIAAARSILDPQLVALSITCRVNDAFMHDEIGHLSNLMNDHCPLVVGGRASNTCRRSIEATGAEICSTTEQWVNLLR